MPIWRWLLLVALTVAGWLAVYFLQATRESSLEPITMAVILLAGLLSLAFVGMGLSALHDLVRPSRRRRRRGDDVEAAGGTAPVPAARVQPPRDAAARRAFAAAAAAELTEEERAKQAIERINMRAGGGLLAALFLYFPLARFFQILPRGEMWAIAGVAAAVGAILVARRARRLRAGFKKRSDLATTVGLSAVAIALCAVMALRLLNAPPGLLMEVTPMHGTISAIGASRGRRHSFTSYTVEVTLDSGAVVSFEVSQKKAQSLGTGYNVELQARRGLLAMPWCLGDCL